MDEIILSLAKQISGVLIPNQDRLTLLKAVLLQSKECVLLWAFLMLRSILLELTQGIPDMILKVICTLEQVTDDHALASPDSYQ